MRWLKGTVIALACLIAATLPASAAGTLQWGTCPANPGPLGVITDGTHGGELVPAGSLVELWDATAQRLVGQAAIGDGIIGHPAGRIAAIESMPDGSYVLQMRVFDVPDPYIAGLSSCAVVVGATGSGTPGLPVTISVLQPASICFPSAEIPDQAYVAGEGGCQTFNPLSVILASFEAFSTPQGVLLRWETVSELENRGFNLYRAPADAGPWARLNDLLIPSQGMGSPAGFVYEYVDANVTVGESYYYLLEDVSVQGPVTQHGPVMILYEGSPTAVSISGFEAAAPGPWRLWPVILAAVAGLAAAASLRGCPASSFGKGQ